MLKPPISSSSHRFSSLSTGSGGHKKPASFPSTCWSNIAAAKEGNTTENRRGLERLATDYWRPLYSYLRKSGEDHEDAADHVQGFLGSICDSNFFEYLDSSKGRFRSYLLRSLERYRSRMHRHDSAWKRGGRAAHFSFDQIEEGHFPAASADCATADEAFDRQWAIDIIAKAVRKVREQYAGRGRGDWFDALRPTLPGGGEAPPYIQLANAFGVSEGAVKKAVFNLRSTFANALREEIRSTVSSNEEAGEELRYLMEVFAT